jgi:hypothetical protein
MREELRSKGRLNSITLIAGAVRWSFWVKRSNYEFYGCSVHLHSTPTSLTFRLTVGHSRNTTTWQRDSGCAKNRDYRRWIQWWDSQVVDQEKNVICSCSWLLQARLEIKKAGTRRRIPSCWALYFLPQITIYCLSLLIRSYTTKAKVSSSSHTYHYATRKEEFCLAPNWNWSVQEWKSLPNSYPGDQLLLM